MLRLLCTAALVSVLLTTANAETITPSDERIQFVGRWDRSNPEQPWCAWQSSTFRVRFRGSRLEASIKTEQVDFLRVIVDGNERATKKLKVTPEEERYVLAEDLGESDHRIEVVKETYSGKGRLKLRGLTVVGGELLPLSPSKPRLNIEFYGDSNLAGYSLEHEKNKGGVAATGCHFTFAGIAARMLDAEYQNISVSGAVIADRVNSLMSFYDRMDFYHAEPRFDFSTFPADICVINIGANDIGKKSKDQIKSDYSDLLSAIRKVRPTAHIVLMNADGWSRSEPANYTDEVLQDFDDDNISRLIFPWYFNEWHGCEYDHAGMAHCLVEHLAKLTPQWKPVRASDVMDGFGRDGNHANGSFEEVAPFGGYGWRYFQDGAERVYDPRGSADGSWFLRLPEGKEVHQPNATKPGQRHRIALKVRGQGSTSKTLVSIEFRDQDWRQEVPDTTIEHTIEPDTKWTDVTIEFKTPVGPVKGDRSRDPWKYLLRLKSVNGVCEFDDIRGTLEGE